MWVRHATLPVFAGIPAKSFLQIRQFLLFPAKRKIRGEKKSETKSGRFAHKPQLELRCSGTARIKAHASYLTLYQSASAVRWLAFHFRFGLRFVVSAVRTTKIKAGWSLWCIAIVYCIRSWIFVERLYLLNFAYVVSLPLPESVSTMFSFMCKLRHRRY